MHAQWLRKEIERMEREGDEDFLDEAIELYGGVCRRLRRHNSILPNGFLQHKEFA